MYWVNALLPKYCDSSLTLVMTELRHYEEGSDEVIF